MDKLLLCSIKRKLQFYKMFQKVFFPILLLMMFAQMAQAQNYIRFSHSVDSVYESSPLGYIYVETNNTTANPFTAFVTLNEAETNVTAFEDFYFSNRLVEVPPNTLQYDTFSYDIYDNDDYDPGKKATFVFATLSDNSFITADSQMVAHIVNDDELQISFVGAGRTVVESDTTVYIRVALNGRTDSTITASVKLDAGNAQKGKHFLFNDTVIAIAAQTKDTALIPVIILNDNKDDGTREANFTLSDVSNDVPLNVRGFTLVIRDDDLVNGVAQNNLDEIQWFPNPASEFILFKNLPEQSRISIFNIQGKRVKVFSEVNNNNKLDVRDLTNGYYFFKIEGKNYFSSHKIAILK